MGGEFPGAFNRCFPDAEFARHYRGGGWWSLRGGGKGWIILIFPFRKLAAMGLLPPVIDAAEQELEGVGCEVAPAKLVAIYPILDGIALGGRGAPTMAGYWLRGAKLAPRTASFGVMPRSAAVALAFPSVTPAPGPSRPVASSPRSWAASYSWARRQRPPPCRGSRRLHFRQVGGTVYRARCRRVLFAALSPPPVRRPRPLRSACRPRIVACIVKGEG